MDNLCCETSAIIPFLFVKSELDKLSEIMKTWKKRDRLFLNKKLDSLLFEQYHDGVNRQGCPEGET